MTKDKSTNKNNLSPLDDLISGAGRNPSGEIHHTHELKMRVYFSSYHLWAANHFVELASKIESTHEGRSKFDIKHRSYITAAVFASVAFLEAVINELYKDATDNRETYIASLGKDIVSKLAKKWEETEERKQYISILRKYKLALKIAQKPNFIETQHPYEDVDLLIKLRNELVHYRPNTLGKTDIHKLQRKLEKKFTNNALMTGSANPFFPDKCLGIGCAQWGLASSKSFTDEFLKKLGLTAHYKESSFNEN